MGRRWIVGAAVVVALVVPSLAAARAPGFEHIHLEEAGQGWRLGFSVDVDREQQVVVAGSPTVEAAFVITRDAGGWISYALQPGDAEAKFDFGASVAIEGDLLAVGAPGYRGPLKQAAGAVFVYERHGEEWRQVALLQAGAHEDATNHHAEQLGTDVDIDGGRIAVGARGIRDVSDSRRTWREGSVYVFERIGGEWVSHHLPNPTAGRDDRFGQSVKIEGDLLVTGAPRNDDVGTNVGAVFVYREKDGRWWFEQAVYPSEPIASLEFGYSVSIHEGEIAVGARATFSRRGPYGRVYLLTQDRSLWWWKLAGPSGMWRADIIAKEVEGQSSFGSEVYFDGRHIYVSSYGYWDPDHHPGVVYVYETSPDGWVLSETIEGDPDEVGFATAMAGDGDAVVFGSQSHSAAAWYSGDISIAGIPEVTCAGQEPTLWGTREDDEIVATIDPDVIYAGAGDDTILEVRGDDVVCTGFGTDTVIVDQMPLLVDVSPQDHVIVGGFRQGATVLG